MLSPAQAISAKNGVVSLSAVDGVLILSLDPTARFDNLRQSIREMFSQTPDRFRGHDARLDLDTRAIDLFDLRRLVNLLREEFGVEITGLYASRAHIDRFAERELKLKLFPSDAFALDLEPEDENLVLMLKDLLNTLAPAEEEVVEEEPAE